LEENCLLLINRVEKGAEDCVCDEREFVRTARAKGGALPAWGSWDWSSVAAA
jgi:hypothetical protein